MSKIDDLRGKLAERKGKSADAVLRASSAENPLSQEEILKYAKENGGMLFDVEKVGIPVDLTKAVGGEKVQTKTLARDGRVIEETTMWQKKALRLTAANALMVLPINMRKNRRKPAATIIHLTTAEHLPR